MNGGGMEKCHFVIVPLFTQGHMIPMMDIARLLALRGVLVTVVSTPVNSARFKTFVDHATAAGLRVRLAEFPFPSAENGLPDGCENLDLMPTMALMNNFFRATNALREPLLRYLREHRPSPSCIVSDSTLLWARDVARELGVPRFVFFPTTCFYLLGSLKASSVVMDDLFEPFILPDFPHRQEVAKAHAERFFNYPGWEDIFGQAVEAEETSDGIVLNTFGEIEAPYLDGYSKAFGNKKIYAVGPVCLAAKGAGDVASRGDRVTSDERQILSWLDAREAKSVIYVSFGSLVRNSTTHLKEIGLGLEASEQAFIWVLKQAELTPAGERWLEELGERTRGRGLIVKGWAPQMLIFSHPSVGGFLTHAGWNSMLEAITAGLPMATCPHYADQFLNAKLLAEMLQIAVQLNPLMRTSYITPASEGFITKEDVEAAVRKLMDGGEEGEGRRKRAEETGRMSRMAMEEGGSSHRSLTLLIEHVMGIADSKVYSGDE